MTSNGYHGRTPSAFRTDDNVAESTHLMRRGVEGVLRVSFNGITWWLKFGFWSSYSPLGIRLSVNRSLLDLITQLAPLGLHLVAAPARDAAREMNNP